MKSRHSVHAAFRTIAFVLFFAESNAKLILDIESINITSMAFSTNSLGVTLSLASLNRTQNWAMNQTGLSFNYIWSFFPPARPSTQVLYNYGARHLERNDPKMHYNLTSDHVDNIVAVSNHGSIDSVEFYGLITNSTRANQTFQWQYIIRGTCSGELKLPCT